MCDLPMYAWFFLVTGIVTWAAIILFFPIAWLSWLFSTKAEEQEFIPRIPRNRKIIRRA